MPTETLGERIRAAHVKKGMSARKLALRMGIAPQNLSDIENGKVNPTYKTLTRIAKALGVSVASLLPPQDKSSVPCLDREKLYKDIEESLNPTTNGHKEKLRD
jgi:transcriptional regulator with XRE-family HTH domain